MDAEELHPTRDYRKYAQITQLYFDTKEDEFAASLLAVGVKMERNLNVFTSLSCVTFPLIFKPDILHNIYLGLFKHWMQWLENFLKKHGRQDIFDDVWKALPPYPEFLVPKKLTRRSPNGKGRRCGISGVVFWAFLCQDPDV